MGGCHGHVSLILCGAFLGATACSSTSTMLPATPGPTPANDAGTAKDASDAGPMVSATGITSVATGEYQTFYLVRGRLYGVGGGTLARRGAGDNPGPQFPPVEVLIPANLTVVASAGGLHFTLAADNDGHVWEWGDIASNPDLANSSIPLQITPDSQGADFSEVVSMAADVASSVAIKKDGTVWVWDDCSGGRQGDGTEGSATVTHPFPVTIPVASGVKIKKVVTAGIVLALATDGSVWSWGGGGTIENLGTNDPDYKQPHQLTTLPSDIVDIATGGAYSYALTAGGELFAWGLYTEIAGLCPGWCPHAVPVSVNGTLKLPAAGAAGAHIASVYANTEASYVILSDGTLWAWGSNGEGLVGNGVEPDYGKTVPPYAWDWGKDELLVSPAVQIAPDVHDFTTLFTGTADVFYAYALTADGKLYSWGRNKTCDLGNGICPLNSQQAATYPNSWDVTVPSLVSPMTAPNTPTSSPECVDHPAAPNCWCGAGPNDPQSC
jgi:alpha-tubulin suppressor-like RCC1 family protein